MKKTLTRTLFIGALGIATHCGTTKAAVLIDGNTLNGGFESLNLATAGDAKQGFDMAGTQDIANWANTNATFAGTAGGYSDTGVDYNVGGAHSGNQFAFVHGGDGGTFNLTSHIIAPGDIFTLTWWGRADTIAMRLFSSSDGGYATNFTLAEVQQVQANNYTQYTLSYDAQSADYGNTIGVSISHPLSGGWANVDDVTLTVIPVPEPSGSISLLFGGAALFLRRSRKRSGGA